mmetsp:Transcript_21941/g.41439  ORF Transcript_21941/g.41439 Transcript_21941/m.41439 type:complete len:92 (-) Transcript_21941:152-427(-)
MSSSFPSLSLNYYYLILLPHYEYWQKKCYCLFRWMENSLERSRDRIMILDRGEAIISIRDGDDIYLLMLRCDSWWCDVVLSCTSTAKSTIA